MGHGGVQKERGGVQMSHVRVQMSRGLVQTSRRLVQKCRGHCPGDTSRGTGGRRSRVYDAPGVAMNRENSERTTAGGTPSREASAPTRRSTM